VRKTGEAVSSYVSKYIEKNVCNRLPDDKRKKLVRYIGWDKSQLKPNEFSWGTARASAWRMKTRALAALVGITDREEMTVAFGPRWAFQFTKLIGGINDAPVTYFDWSYPERELARREVARLSERYCRKKIDHAFWKIDAQTLWELEHSRGESIKELNALRYCDDWNRRMCANVCAN
jgi:hypothetical protein